MGPVLDFSASYMTFFTKPHQGGNIARIMLDAACTVTNKHSGSSTTFYLIAPCRSEHMYRDGPLFQMPNYEFSGVWSADELKIVRRHWTSDKDNNELAHARDRFERVEFDIRTLPNPNRLANAAEIVAATLANRPLVARTAFELGSTNTHVTLEYPVKTMNVTMDPKRFQVDTGPLIVPGADADEATFLATCDIAHVVYHGFDKAEFVLRRPVGVGARDGRRVEVTDYSEILILPVRNELFSA